jgi:hypothetical protein
LSVHHSMLEVIRGILMADREFIQGLFESGRVSVCPPSGFTSESDVAIDDTLVSFERNYRLDLPGEPPTFSLAAARWGAITLLNACQLLVYRDLDADQVAALLTVPCPEPPNASTSYSVDLVLRFLPDVARHAAGANREDPLVAQIRKLGNQWPLSSVGIAAIEPTSLEEIVAQPCLLAMYVDRVIATHDVARLTNRSIRTAVQAAIGLHSELAPELASALLTPEPEGFTS